MHGSLWRQKLDYWKIHFRCFICRQVGHLAKDCTTSEQRNTQSKNKVKGTAQNKRRCETQSKDGAKEPNSSEGSLCATPGKKALRVEINSLVIFATSRECGQSPAKNLMLSKSFIKNPELETTMVDIIQELSGSLSPEKPTLSITLP